MLEGIDHVAIAVPSIEEALPLWRDHLGFDHKGFEVIEEHGVRAALLTKGPHRVELLEPLNDESPIARFLKKSGPGLHHMCLKVDDVSEHLESLERAGLRLIDKKPRPGADERLVAFLHPKSTGGVLLELSQVSCGHQGNRDEPDPHDGQS